MHLVYAYYGNGEVFDTVTANLSNKHYSFQKLINSLPNITIHYTAQSLCETHCLQIPRN